MVHSLDLVDMAALFYNDWHFEFTGLLALEVCHIDNGCCSYFRRFDVNVPRYFHHSYATGIGNCRSSIVSLELSIPCNNPITLGN